VLFTIVPASRLAAANTCVPQEGLQDVVVILIVDVEAVQGGLEIVHCKIAVPGTAKPVTPEVGEEGVVMVAVPLTTLHVPVPDVGILPAKVAVVTPQAGFWSGPAAAVVGAAETDTEAVLAGVQPQVLQADNV
jgi:hypothetical protein